MLAWFPIMEQHHMHNTNKTKILSHIGLSFFKYCWEILQQTDYDILKEAVIFTYGKSKPKMLGKLITTSDMAGCQSIYLKELMSLVSRISVGDDMDKT